MSALREFLWILSLPCTQATRLISESLDRRLPWRLRMAIRVHQWTCVGCRHYHRQVEALRAALARKLLESGMAPLTGAPMLSNDARERIKRSLRDAGSSSSKK